MAGDSRVAAVYLLRDDGAALFQHRDDKPGIRHPGMWTPPGGHCEDHETTEECARREFLEETGYVCDVLRRLRAIRGSSVPDGVELTVFWGRYDGRQPVKCYEGQDLRFLTRDAADDFAIPPYLLDLWDTALVAHAGSPPDMEVR
jgi:8-oxo-dGTP pyrophosphatase MutT (NUDIX family)